MKDNPKRSGREASEKATDAEKLSEMATTIMASENDLAKEAITAVIEVIHRQVVSGVRQEEPLVPVIDLHQGYVKNAAEAARVRRHLLDAITNMDDHHLLDMARCVDVFERADVCFGVAEEFIKDAVHQHYLGGGLTPDYLAEQADPARNGFASNFNDWLRTEERHQEFYVDNRLPRAVAEPKPAAVA